MTTMKAKFGGRCRKCGGWMPSGSTIAWSRENGAVHAAACPTAAATPAVERPAVVVDASAVVQFLLAARARGLQWPKARFLAPGGGELRLSVAGQRAAVPGAVQVVVDEEWHGRVNPDGVVVGRLAEETPLLETLRRIATDPATVAAEYGRLTGNCSFCSKALKDEGSVEAGYGPVCAKKWGLEHRRKGAKAMAVLPMEGAA